MADRSGLGVGVDVVDIEDFSATLHRSGADFITDVFTSDEIEYCKDRRPQHYGVRWAAKEAFFKATSGALPGEASYHEVEVTLDSRGAPQLRLSGAAACWAKDAGLAGSSVSLSHSRRTSMAAVILHFRPRSALYGQARWLLRVAVAGWQRLVRAEQLGVRESMHWRCVSALQMKPMRSLNIGQVHKENG